MPCRKKRNVWHRKVKCKRCGRYTTNIRKHYWERHKAIMMAGVRKRRRR